MNQIGSFATTHPLVFGLVVTLVFVLMLLASAVLGALWPGEPHGQYIGGAVGRLVSIAIMLTLLYRLGWLGPAGITQLGSRRIWLIALLALGYAIAISAYTLMGDLGFSFSNPALTGFVTVFILIAAFLEEVVFRGLILHAFVRAWGSTNRGLLKCILLSSMFFSGIHILDIIGGRPLPNVLLQSLETFFLGIWLAALVLVGNSIYPSAVFHGLLNLAGLSLILEASEPAPAAWFLLSLWLLPLAAIGIYLLRGWSQNSSIPHPGYR